MHYANGRIYTQDRAGTVVSSFAADAGRFTSVGDDTAPPSRSAAIDLRGRTVLPGLIDAHAHLRNLAESRLSVDLGGSSSALDAAARIARSAAERPAGAWLTGRGWDQTVWPERQFPTTGPLDALAIGPYLLVKPR